MIEGQASGTKAPKLRYGMIGGGTVGSGVFHALQRNGGLLASRIGVRVAVRLINAADGFTLWADEYERELADIFQIQDDIAGAVVKNLEDQLAGAPKRNR
jgi:homoserine dehydrogenase